MVELPVIFPIAVIDAFFPLVPSETLVVIGGNLAAAGDLSSSRSCLAGASRRRRRRQHLVLDRPFVGERTVKRWFRTRRHRRLDWAERTLDERGAYIILIARFIRAAGPQ